MATAARASGEILLRIFAAVLLVDLTGDQIARDGLGDGKSLAYLSGLVLLLLLTLKVELARWSGRRGDS